MIRPRPSSPASPVPAIALNDDDLLLEILLRLPPQPSSLPRASLVCKRWRRLVADPGFRGRFRAHHREPPFLGIFLSDHGVASFFPMMEPPDHIPAARFSLPQSGHERSVFYGCRHGLAVLCNLTRLEAVVWDPLTGHQRCVACPPGFGNSKDAVAVLCTASDAGHVHGECHLSSFKLVFVRTDSYCTRAFACLYESESGVWGDVISLAMGHNTGMVMSNYRISSGMPSVLVRNALYWLLSGGNILEFDFEMQTLVMIEKPTDVRANKCRSFQILRTDDSGLGLAILSDMNIQLWERKSTYNGVMRWLLQKTIQLDLVLQLKAQEESRIYMVGYIEDNNVIFLWINFGVFMIQLEPMEFKNYFGSNCVETYYPYTNFYASDF